MRSRKLGQKSAGSSSEYRTKNANCFMKTFTTLYLLISLTDLWQTKDSGGGGEGKVSRALVAGAGLEPRSMVLVSGPVFSFYRDIMGFWKFFPFLALSSVWILCLASSSQAAPFR